VQAFNFPSIIGVCVCVFTVDRRSGGSFFHQSIVGEFHRFSEDCPVHAYSAGLSAGAPFLIKNIPMLKFKDTIQRHEQIQVHSRRIQKTTVLTILHR
jgi:hypothetical protein